MQKSPEAFRTIGEVASWLGVPPHVLRFWESKFAQVKPVKRAGGRRYYRRGDMALLGGIKVLLHDRGMTIKGVQRILSEDGAGAVTAHAPELDEEADAADEPQEAARMPEDEPQERANGSPLPGTPAAEDEVESTRVPLVRRPRIERGALGAEASDDGEAPRAEGSPPDPVEPEGRPADGAEAPDMPDALTPASDAEGEDPVAEASGAAPGDEAPGDEPPPDGADAPSGRPDADAAGPGPVEPDMPRRTEANATAAEGGGDAPGAAGSNAPRSNDGDPGAAQDGRSGPAEPPEAVADDAAPAPAGPEAGRSDPAESSPVAGVAPADHLAAQREGDGATGAAALGVPDDGAGAGGPSASRPLTEAGRSDGTPPETEGRERDARAPVGSAAAGGPTAEPARVASDDDRSSRVPHRRPAARADHAAAPPERSEEPAGRDRRLGRADHAATEAGWTGSGAPARGGPGHAAGGVMVAEREPPAARRPISEPSGARGEPRDGPRHGGAGAEGARMGPARAAAAADGETDRAGPASGAAPGDRPPGPSRETENGSPASREDEPDAAASSDPSGGEDRPPHGAERPRAAVAAVPPGPEDGGRTGRRLRPRPAAVHAHHDDVLALVRRLEAVRDRIGP